MSELYTQSISEAFKELLNKGSMDANTIAMLSQVTRENKFRISVHPEGMVKLNALQNKSKNTFIKQIETLPKEEQSKMWNLSRYDKLFQQLVQTVTQESNLKTVIIQFHSENQKEKK